MKIKSATWTDNTHKTLRVVDDDDVVRFVPMTGEGQYAKMVEEHLTANIVAEDKSKTTVENGLDELDVYVKALGLVVAQWCGKTPGQLKTAFKDALDGLKGK